RRCSCQPWPPSAEWYFRTGDGPLAMLPRESFPGGGIVLPTWQDGFRVPDQNPGHGQSETTSRITSSVPRIFPDSLWTSHRRPYHDTFAMSTGEQGAPLSTTRPLARPAIRMAALEERVLNIETRRPPH